MTGPSSIKLRLVRCPKCRQVLPEPANSHLYMCGGCNTVLRAKRIHISLVGRFAPRPSALPGGGEIVGPIALSSSEFASTNNKAQRVRQDKSGSAASDSKKKRTREQEDCKEINTSITLEDVAESLGVSVSTLKRTCRQYGIKRWPNIIRKKAGRLPDQHGEENPSPTCETLSTNGQTEMENEIVEGPNEAGFSSECEILPESHFSPDPNSDGTVVPHPHITSTQILGENMGSLGDWRNLFASLEEPLLQVHVSGSMWTVPPCLDEAPSRLMPTPCCDPAPSQPTPTSITLDDLRQHYGSIDWKEINTSITLDDLRQHYGRKRKDVADSLGVSVSTLKRTCRKYGIKRWPNIIRKKVSRPPDQHGERNTSTARETPSHNVQTGMEGVLFGLNEEANEFRPDFTEGCTIPSNTENGLIIGSSFGFPPPQITSMPSENMGGSIDLRSSLANLTFAATCSDQAAPSQHVQGQSMHPTVYPDHNVFPQTQIASSQEPFSEVMIKAFYRDAENTIIKFLFPLTSGIVDLKKEVSKRLNVEVDRFVVKYKDKYEDLISILCNEDLILCLLSSLGNDEINVLVHDKVGGTPNFCEKCRSSMQTRA